ncbi:MAG: hypothetical protein JNM44_14710 [Chitinophagaceae bacterium]|nr:hypothetical protein [Chitinophagaceae bacterium]
MFIISSCGQSPYEKLATLDTPKKAATEGDWLAEHSESYQSFSDYKSGHPIQSSSQRPFLYVVKMGKYSTWDDSLFFIPM